MNETIAARLKKAIAIRHISQADLVEKTKISKGALSSYISGRYVPKQNNVHLLAKALDVSEDWLTGANVPMEASLINIIRQRLLETNMTIEELSHKAAVPLSWLQSIDSFTPGESPEDWGEGTEKCNSYQRITRVAEILELPGSVLRKALARQEIPIPEDLPRVSAKEAFGGVNIYSSQDTSKPESLSVLEQNHMEKYRELDAHGKEMVDFTLLKEWERSTAPQKPEEPPHNDASMRLINYYYRLASAGTGQIIFDMPPTKRIEIPNIPEYRKADYAIGVNGNSMEPVYHDGEMLLVEMADEIEAGEIGIFMVDNESYVKKLGEGELISLNPKYSNIPLTENSKCMGRVIAKL